VSLDLLTPRFINSISLQNRSLINKSFTMSSQLRLHRQQAPSGSPIIKIAVKKALQHPDLSSYKVLILCKYTHDEAIDRNKQKLLSKKKRKIKDAEGKENNRTAIKNHHTRRANTMPLVNITVDTEALLVSDVTTTVNDDCSQFSSSHTASTGFRATLTTAASSRKTSPFSQRKQLSST
jgi:hypothetical protein